jgi:hypothetical protein
MGTPRNPKSLRIEFISIFWARSEMEAAVVKAAKVGGRAFTCTGNQPGHEGIRLMQRLKCRHDKAAHRVGKPALWQTPLASTALIIASMTCTRKITATPA